MRKLLMFLFSHRLLAVARWDIHFLNVRLSNALAGRKRRIRALVAARQRPLYLNLGSGPRGLDDPHWLNVDGFYDRNVHYVLDFNRPLPFEDASFDGVFCEHVIEHFSLEDGEALSREVCRILRPGGSFRVIVPDAELVLKRYFSEPAELSAYREISGSTPMEAVNSFFRQRYEHQFLYDAQTMQKMLLAAGFKTATRSGFGVTGNLPPVVLDDAKYEWESLYVEAVK